jgi:hypothetical protein
MKLFECQACGQPLYFENDRCESCGRPVGFLSDSQALSALDAREAGRTFRALAAPDPAVRLCANAGYRACNWLVPADGPEAFCTACRHNRTIPDLSLPENLERWRRLETAKRRLFYTLLRLGLPLTKRPEDPEGLAFDFLSDHGPSAPPVMTGHASRLITINIAGADDVERERRRTGMGEPYRTLLRHFGHEVGHHYWTVLVERSPDPGTIERFRALFGDELADYGAALKRHYAAGAPPEWRGRFISAYASAHPWENWAETWAHYLHMVDTLETAGAFGITTRPKVSRRAEIATTVDFDPHADGDLELLIGAWLPLTFAVNSLNRSMGQPDLYPLVMPPAVVGKLTFVHGCVHSWAKAANIDRKVDVAATTASDETLRAVIAGLRTPVAAPRGS